MCSNSVFMKYIIIFLSVVFIAILIWHFLTKKYLNPFKMYIIFGPKGVGKSTLLQKLIKYYKSRGYHIYCNIGDSPSPNIVEIKIEDIGLLAKAYKDKALRLKLRNQYKSENIISADCILPKSVIFCDEINLIWDNRSFKQFRKDQQEYFRLQRHYKHIFIGFSQTFDTDKKIRDLADILVLLKKYGRVYIYGQCWRKNQVVVGATEENNRDQGLIVDNFIPLGIFYNLFSSPFKCWLPKWVKHHDSFK